MYSFEDLLPNSDDLIGVYLHVPFCKIRCSYCDAPKRACWSAESIFQVSGGRIKTRVVKRDLVVDTLYFGGGTRVY